MKTYTNLNELNFVSVLLVSPSIKIGDVEYNTNLIINEIEKNVDNTNLIVFPELCLTGNTCGDYFLNDNLVKELDNAIYSILKASYNSHSTIILGTCVSINEKLLNCALFISDGKLLGIVPKNSNSRWFGYPDIDSIIVNGYDVKISSELIFQSFYKIGICFGSANINSLNLLSETEIVICLDSSPYSFTDKKDKTIRYISNVTNQAILYVGSNTNESSTDNVYYGELFACECGKTLANNYYLDVNNSEKNKLSDKDVFDFSLSANPERISRILNYPNFDTKHYKTEIDIDIIRGKRKHTNIFNAPKQNCNCKNKVIKKNEIVKFDFITKKFDAIRRLSKYDKSIYLDPFNTYKIIHNPLQAFELLTIQALALAKRIKDINCKSLVIGVSSGVDSTLSLLVTVRCFEILGLNKKNIFAISLPGLATHSSSNEIAEQLCKALGVSYSIISISDCVHQHFKDIKHNKNNFNIVYENAQARMRTMVLLDIANAKKGILVGTGDMSESALGWCTFNGDHMSNYNVNGGVPKTVAQAILSSIINSDLFPQLAVKQLKLILNKPISPELIPSEKTGKIQATEEILGPYELHDFFLYYYVKYFFSKEKILYIASLAFEDKYSVKFIENTFNIFMKRFKQNQYKRNCSVDAPAIYDISLSPRGGLVFPSDM
jgi:NAD+ synthase (glutamine-hydrolysing)